MKVISTPHSPQDVNADALVVGIWSDGTLTAAARQIDEAGAGLIAGLISRREATGRLYELTALHGVPGITTPLVLVVGLGDAAKFEEGTAYRTAAAAARHLSGKVRNTVVFYLGDAGSQHAAAGIAGAMVGTVGSDLYRREKKRFSFEQLLWHGADSKAIERGTIIGDAINLARRLVNEPPDVLYPETFVAEAVAVAQAEGLTYEVWDLPKLTAERCHSLCSVAKGSDRPPRLFIVEYRGGKAGEPPIALVGKGVTFDSGGLSLKPTDGMTTMKCDMAGAATMLAVVQAAARLKLPVNLIGFAGLIENMLGGSAMKLGDVLTARSGKTIEVLNTDAEGRLVLADVLNVALDRAPAKIIDLATLTGACVVALGNDTVGAFSNNQPWCDSVVAAARATGEPLWQMPMFPEYSEHIRTEIADIKNTGDGRWGGAITAAKFLEEFVDGTPWVHLDIAGPAYYEKPRPWADIGGSGCMVRMLIELLGQG
ncbi:MAG: leucyl aminopeptidase [Planctomycetia bacterium]|nr:leucyl aminopeptidase [Planctomycetia bacterium]